VLRCERRTTGPAATLRIELDGEHGVTVARLGNCHLHLHLRERISVRV